MKRTILISAILVLVFHEIAVGRSELLAAVRRTSTGQQPASSSSAQKSTTTPNVVPPSAFTITPALKEHYANLRNEIYEGYLAGKQSRNMRFYIAASLHDMSKIEWSLCADYQRQCGIDCNSSITVKLKRLALTLASERRDLAAIKNIYDYVNKNIRYAKEEGNIPQFPYETLTRGKGDCEDQAMLLATMLELAGFEAVIIRINDPARDFNHALCAVKIDPSWTPYREWKFEKYASYGHCWKILDPAFNQDFNRLPQWFDNYRPDGIPVLPQSIAQVLILDRDEYRRLCSESDGVPVKAPQSTALPAAQQQIPAGQRVVPPYVTEQAPVQRQLAVNYEAVVSRISLQDMFGLLPDAVLGVAADKKEIESQFDSVKGTYGMQYSQEYPMYSVIDISIGKVNYPFTQESWEEEAAKWAATIGGSIRRYNGYPVVYNKGPARVYDIANGYCHYKGFSLTVGCLGKYSEGDYFDTLMTEALNRIDALLRRLGFN